MSEPKKKVLALVAELDADELATRLIEIGCHMKRPMGLKGKEAMDAFRKRADKGQIPTYIVRDFEAMAHVAIKYMGECVQNASKPN